MNVMQANLSLDSCGSSEKSKNFEYCKNVPQNDAHEYPANPSPESPSYVDKWNQLIKGECRDRVGSDRDVLSSLFILEGMVQFT